MRIQYFTRTVLIGAAALTLFLLLAALVVTARSVGGTHSEFPIAYDDDELYAPSSPGQVRLPRSTAAYNGVSTPAKELFAPWLLGETSVLHVFNTSQSAAATVQITFVQDGAGGPVVRTAMVDRSAVGKIDTTDLVPAAKYSAIITATEPIVVVVNDFGPEGKQATSYAAMSAGLGQPYLALPDILSTRGNEWNSQIVVQNVGELSTRATIVYTQTEPPTRLSWSETLPTLLPGQTHRFDPADAAGLPENFEGIATIRSQQPLVAIVHNSAEDQLPAYIYRVPLPAGGGASERSLHFPLLLNTFADWENSDIQIMNASSGQIATTYQITVGHVAVIRTIEPGLAKNHPQNVNPNEDYILSDPGEAVAGGIKNAASLYSVVWLNRTGFLVGDPFAAYSTPSLGAKTWYLAYADQGDTFSTYIAVQNISGGTAHIVWTPHDGAGPLDSGERDIEAGETSILAGGSGLPQSFVGGVVVESDRPVIAIGVIAGRLVLDNATYMPVVTK